MKTIILILIQYSLYKVVKYHKSKFMGFKIYFTIVDKWDIVKLVSYLKYVSKPFQMFQISIGIFWRWLGECSIKYIWMYDLNSRLQRKWK
jgi:hypothetical protein